MEVVRIYKLVRDTGMSMLEGALLVVDDLLFTANKWHPRKKRTHKSSLGF